MAVVRVGICDDESVALGHVAQSIKMEFQMNGIDAETELFSASNMLIRRFSEKPAFDVLFLDIDMPSINGIELAKKARALSPASTIVFVTSKDEYVFASFKVQPFRYIRKQDFSSEIHECISALVNEMPRKVVQNYLTLAVGQKVVRICVSDIHYIECVGKNIYIHTSDEITELRYTLSEIEEMLSDYPFFRIHKSFIVNGDYIYSIESREIMLTTGESLPLSRYRVQETKAKFQEMILCR